MLVSKVSDFGQPKIQLGAIACEPDGLFPTPNNPISSSLSMFWSTLVGHNSCSDSRLEGEDKILSTSKNWNTANAKILYTNKQIFCF